MVVDIARLGPTILSPSLRASRTHEGRHFVHIYEDDGSLVDAVKTFVSVGLHGGEVALVVATPAHRRGFEEALRSSGVDLTAAREEGRYLELDAEETLEGFMVDGKPEPALFQAVVGQIVEQSAASGRNLRVFGEMVALLWDQGNVSGTMELELLWNQLGETRPFELFCAYAADGFDGETLLALREVCGQHTHVIPPRR